MGGGSNTTTQRGSHFRSLSASCLFALTSELQHVVVGSYLPGFLAELEAARLICELGYTLWTHLEFIGLFERKRSSLLVIDCQCVRTHSGACNLASTDRLRLGFRSSSDSIGRQLESSILERPPTFPAHARGYPSMSPCQASCGLRITAETRTPTLH